jgi:hypothetical protein
VSATNPTAGQILIWDGSVWAPGNQVGGSSGAAGGALTGTYPNPALAEGAVTTASLANGSVTEPKLAFNPATQAELDAASATAAAAAAALQTTINAASEALNAYKALLANSGGTANTPGNPVSWTQLRDVPSEVIAGGGASGVSGGDLSGNYPNPAVAKLQGTAVSSTAPTNGQVLAFDGSAWKPTAATSGGSGISGWESTEGASFISAGESGVVKALCPAGKKATGGGHEISGPARLQLTQAMIGGEGWAVLVDNSANTNGVQVFVYAVCVNAAP